MVLLLVWKRKAVVSIVLAGHTKRKASQKKRSKEEALLSLEIEKKTREAEHQELRQLLDAERKAFESERQELRETIVSEEKKCPQLESECAKLRKTIASKEKKIKELESASQKGWFG
ncbi:perforin-1-like [Platysternon megacephalum]|uniref:Perforin-1-like n=1 Tax=Platysternon megacephalum TaxID=55544 RepID=A0A4D9DK04_9SAUR|nr:perforin-1-like [Platysternon megacephalum]